jgi:hypothetical protein
MCREKGSIARFLHRLREQSIQISLHNEKTYSPLFNNTTNNFLVLLGLEVLGSLGCGGGFDDDDAEAGALGVERSDSEVIHG